MEKYGGLAVDKRGKPLNEKTLIRGINKKLEAFGEKYNLNLKSHSFRIGYVTRLFESKVEGILIQSLVNHKNYATTLKYNRNVYSTKDKLAALKKQEKKKKG